MVSTGAWTREHDVVATLIEKLRCHHHLLLLACVCVWCLSLIHQVKQVCLVGRVLVADATCGANSIVSNRGGSSAECAGPSCVTLVLCHH